MVTIYRDSVTHQWFFRCEGHKMPSVLCDSAGRSRAFYSAWLILLWAKNNNIEVTNEDEFA